jgi:hypothetical protein
LAASGTVTIEADAVVSAAGVGTVRLQAQGSGARLVVAGDLLSASGDITLVASQSIDKTPAARIATLGTLAITAMDGLRIVDGGNTTAVGVLGRNLSPGLVQVQGNQTFNATQTFAVNLSGSKALTEYDQWMVSGTATLAGSLDLVLEPEFTLQLGDEFVILTAQSLLGRFDNASDLFGFGDGSLYLKVVQTAQSLKLVVTERPLANVLQMTQHTVLDADKLGMFFNPDYFGQRAYDVGMAMAVEGFFFVDGNFYLGNTAVTVKPSDGSVVDTQRWTIGATDLNAFVGLNGPTLNQGALGFELTGVDLGLALYLEQPTVGASTVPRTWLSLAASSESAKPVGLGQLDISATDLSVSINTGSDGTVIDYGSSPLQVVTGTTQAAKAVELGFQGSAGTLIRAAGQIDRVVDETQRALLRRRAIFLVDY